MPAGTATRLIRLFKKPGGGAFLAILNKGDSVEIVRTVVIAGTDERWLEVDTDKGHGFVKPQFISVDAGEGSGPPPEEPEPAEPEPEEPGPIDLEPADVEPEPAPKPAPPPKPKPPIPDTSKIPPEADDRDIEIDDDGNVFGPGKVRFGKLHKLGLFNSGATSIADFIEAHPDDFADIPPSLPRVMVAVSTNEGKLEAINTWDAAFLSFGVYQWTAGKDEEAGELSALLSRLKASAPETFATHFGKHGLDADAKKPGAGVTPTGTLSVDGVTLDVPKRKEKLRTHLWAYRFWRAGHDDVVRKAEIDHAIARIDVFYRVPRNALGDRPVSDFITSEVGVTHLLDQHVNRPGHVPDTLVKAVNAFIDKTGRSNPDKWGDGDEAAVIKLYLAERAKTSMTDSQGRADKIDAAADRGALSRKRGSFA